MELQALRYRVYADRNRRHLIAAFELEGDARQFLHLHCPCSGEIVDSRDEQPQANSAQE